jgi:hypothetical protein
LFYRNRLPNPPALPADQISTAKGLPLLLPGLRPAPARQAPGLSPLHSFLLPHQHAVDLQPSLQQGGVSRLRPQNQLDCKLADLYFRIRSAADSQGQNQTRVAAAADPGRPDGLHLSINSIKLSVLYSDATEVNINNIISIVFNPLLTLYVNFGFIFK